MCGLSCLTPLSTIFIYIVAINIIGGVNRRYPEKTTDLSQVTDKLYHIKLYRVHLVWTGFKLTTIVVIGTDCTGSYKSNYYMITKSTAPLKIGIEPLMKISIALFFTRCQAVIFPLSQQWSWSTSLTLSLYLLLKNTPLKLSILVNWVVINKTHYTK